MISEMGDVKNRDFTNIDKAVREYCGLSTDTKPTTGIKNGSTLLEMDTKKVFIFDETNSIWREL